MLDSIKTAVVWLKWGLEQKFFDIEKMYRYKQNIKCFKEFVRKHLIR